MNQQALIAAAAASLLSSLLVASPAAAQSQKEKCYGIAAVGQNDCANLAGTHSCAGQSAVDKDRGEWKYVAKGTCESMKGMTQAQAKKAATMKDGEMMKDDMKKNGDMKKDMDKKS